MANTQTDNGFLSCLAGEALEQYRRVKLSSGEVVYADAGDPSIGVTQEKAADAERVTVKLWTAGGTFLIESAGAVTQEATVYGADDGKVDDTVAGLPIGIAREAATGAAEMIEIVAIPQHSLGDSAGDTLLRTDQAAADSLKLSAYDVGASAYADVITIASHATAPTLAIAAEGAITISGAAGTADMTLTSGNDLLLKGGDAASDVVKVQVYDVDGSAYADVVTATAGNTPTLGLAAAGAITIDGSGGTADMTLTSGNDLLLKSGDAASDLVKIQAYDVDSSAYDDVITVTAGNTPTLNLAADGGLSFFDAAAATQQAHIADTTTDPTNIVAAVNSALAALETFGFVATA